MPKEKGVILYAKSNIFSLIVIFTFGLGFRDMTVFPNLTFFLNGYNFRLISHRKINEPPRETSLLAQPDKHKKFPVGPTASAWSLILDFLDFLAYFRYKRFFSTPSNLGYRRKTRGDSAFVTYLHAKNKIFCSDSHLFLLK